MSVSSDSLQLYKRLISYVKPYRRVFYMAVLAMVVLALTDTGFAALMKPMLDESLVARNEDMIVMLPLMIIALFIIRGLSGIASTYSMSWIGRKVIEDLRSAMFDHLLKLPTSFYDQNASGKLIQKFTFDTEQVSQAVTNALIIMIRDTLTIIALLAWMFYLNWVLSLVFLLIAPAIFVMIYIVNKRFRKISSRILDSIGDVSHVVEEVTEGSRVVKLFNGQKMESETFSVSNSFNRLQNMKLVLTSAISVSVVQFIAACALAGIVFLATLDPMLGTMTPGTFISFIFAMMILLAPLKRITGVTALLQRGIAAADNIFKLLDEEVEKDQGTRVVKRAQGRLELRHITLCYDIEKGDVLKDINLIIEPGTTLAIVGKSGSGKSSLVNLLPRFYEPSDGQILLDGVNIQDYTLNSLRRQYSYVSQNITLFNDTLARNIAYGSMAGASTEDIVKAADMAHASEFINRLPQGMETIIGENGVMLSGGQRQRLAIARAMLAHAPILILDEATSALDAESESIIQQGLSQLIADHTTIVIAHRLSTIENADIIAVLDQGRIIESGTHQQLLDQKSHYYNLYRVQFEDS